MINQTSSSITSRVQLREVIETDLPIFFEQQLDPEATQMAAFPARDREAFMTHWTRILGDETIIKKTILLDGQVAGNIVSFEQDGQPQVGYWLGQAYWDQGIATQALAVFLDQVKTRPLYAYVAKHNIASRRVLEKCGFTMDGESQESTDPPVEAIEEFRLKLEANEGNKGG